MAPTGFSVTVPSPQLIEILSVDNAPVTSTVAVTTKPHLGDRLSRLIVIEGGGIFENTSTLLFPV
ncbi:MAG TPA: hypothetical protein VHJ59_08575, partial [Nitrososphaera sp.]|nr:hypothetical protein [Nitrososphaera sp.]